jgi:tetratricopeptide (TPR) repeat protein
VQAEDWPAAIERLTWIRGEDPEFRRGQVEERLFQVYAFLARQELEEARGDVDRVQLALEYLRQALILRPTQQDLKTEQQQARAYVTGAEAYAGGDWVVAVQAWEPVYIARRDYQDGVLARRMRETYPRAADALIEQANGDLVKLQQAIGYLEQALLDDPENQELLAERHFALEYRAGADAFAKERWDEAIGRWGPIHDLRPDYQGGLLEENLKTSCAESRSPSETWCP